MTEPDWLIWTRELQAIAQTGLAFTRDPYDRVRYETLRGLASKIMAAHTSAPAERIDALFAGETGYATPKVGVRGAAFDEQEPLAHGARSGRRRPLDAARRLGRGEPDAGGKHREGNARGKRLRGARAQARGRMGPLASGPSWARVLVLQVVLHLRCRRREPRRPAWRPRKSAGSPSTSCRMISRLDAFSQGSSGACSNMRAIPRYRLTSTDEPGCVSLTATAGIRAEMFSHESTDLVQIEQDVHAHRADLVGWCQQVRHHDRHHASGMGRTDPIERILNGKTLIRGDTEQFGGAQEQVRVRLAARDIIACDDYRQVRAQARTAEVRFGGMPTGRCGDRLLQPVLSECIQQFRRSRLQWHRRAQGTVDELTVQPVEVGERESRAKMVAKHRIAYRAGHPDHRMTEGIRDCEAEGMHRLLERGMIHALGVMQRPVHVEDNGTEASWQGHHTTIGGPAADRNRAPVGRTRVPEYR